MTSRFDKVNDSILIGGCGRSGTSILGKVISACKHVEYIYDPAFLHHFMYYSERMDTEAFQNTYIHYLYDEFLINALAGRNLNFNQNDGSYIGKAKTKEELDRRLAQSHSRLSLNDSIERSIISYKITDATFTFVNIKKAFPGIRGVFIYRNASDVINSLIAKNWFSNESLSTTTPYPLIDFVEYKGQRMPSFVDVDKREFWHNATEAERCAHYYITANSSLLNFSEDTYFVDYDEMIVDSHKVLGGLFTHLGLEQTPKSEAILSTIRAQESKKKNLNDWLSQDWIDKIMTVEGQVRKLSNNSIVNQ